MVGDVVFVDLDHGPPRGLLVRQLGLAANTDDSRVVRAGSHEPVQGIGSNGLRNAQLVGEVSGKGDHDSPYQHR